MVAQRHTMKRGDLLPALVVTLLDDRTPVPLGTALSVTLRLRAVASDTPVLEAAMDTLAELGQVTYEWQAGNTDVAGDFEAEVIVQWPTGPQTFPGEDFIYVQITDTLEAPAP